MAEISLILTSAEVGSAATAVAVADGGTGVSLIPPAAVKSLLDIRDRIVQMMNARAPRMSSDDLRLFGQEMRKALFSEEVGATWLHANNAAVPLVTKILATSPELKAIPWEYAAMPSGQDSPQLAASVVRLVPQARAMPLAPIARANLRILLLSASPLHLKAISWNEVRDRLIQVFHGALPNVELVADDRQPAGASYIRIVEAATRKSVGQWLDTVDPHVVHFIGHGTDRGVALINSKKNDPTLMTGAAFQAALLRAPSCRLVILSACDTANQAAINPVDATIGTLAEQLVRNAVPAVRRQSDRHRQADDRDVLPGLYLELVKSGSIDQAVAAGRCEIARNLDEVDSAAIELGHPGAVPPPRCRPVVRLSSRWTGLPIAYSSTARARRRSRRRCPHAPTASASGT